MQSARCCLVILLRQGLAQKSLHAGGRRISNHNRVAREANWPSLRAYCLSKEGERKISCLRSG
jgi:hypothetical protein